MGNSLGGRKKAKVMKINGETFKFKTPMRAWDVVKDHPGHVLLESEAVKRYGIRAKPLEPQQELKPKKIYFLVELPKFPEEKMPIRSQSAGIHMSAKDRLECLMLSRRTVSDLSNSRPSSSVVSDRSGPLKVKIRLPSAQVARLVAESKDGVEVAEKILDLYMEQAGEVNGDVPEAKNGLLEHRETPWKPVLGSIGENNKAHKKRVSFVRVEEEEICPDAASN
ncbi:hypothetical protein F2P56_000758 [Juglans regia]|uniref:Uncharacterized protein At1g66480 n=2 Tax=Juglans regia TaxID=51240 RepID=A0A2I4EBN2_JUGRE|nr:uncharacterized protein At1g66480 [Juglans regia]KAF5479978.1 hypothetical protein F2P56_000758 [Juglans regia]